MKRAALLCICLLLALTPAARAQESALQRAVRLTGEGDLVAALAAARSGDEPLAVAQAELYVLHHAGALEQALEAGLGGLQLAPRDPWLLERCAYIAITLGAGELGQRLVDDLREELSPEEWRQKAWMLEQVHALRRERSEEASALARARLVTELFAGAALLVSLYAARRRAVPAA